MTHTQQHTKNRFLPHSTDIREVMTTETSTDVEPDRCRMCETVLPAEGVSCPRCGVRFRVSAPDPVEARTQDIILAVLLAVIAITATVPLTYPVLRSLATPNTSGNPLFEIVAVAMWNGVILGIPILQLGRRWYARVRAGHFEHAWVWRQYWKWQALALTPLWFCLGIGLLNGDFYWLWQMMMR